MREQLGHWTEFPFRWTRQCPWSVAQSIDQFARVNVIIKLATSQCKLEHQYKTLGQHLIIGFTLFEFTIYMSAAELRVPGARPPSLVN